MSACAAYDFFTLDEQNLHNTTAQYLYRSVELDEAKNLTFRGTDFVSQSKASEFMQKLGSFLTLAHIILSKHGGALLQNNNVANETRGTRGFIARLAEQQIPDYNDMNKEQSKEIDDYMKEFAYSIMNGSVVRGWIYQVYNSVRMAGVSRFLFPSKVFEENVMALASMDPCKEIQEEKKSGLFKTDKRTDYDDFIKNLPKCPPVADKQNVSTMKERFLAHMFNAINRTIPFSAKL